MSLKRAAVSIFSAGILTLGIGVALGQQDYPNKPIRIIAGGVGSGSDFTARQIAQGISGPLRQPVTVENRGGQVAAVEAASKVPADGYTLLLTGGGLWVSPLIRKVPYDPKDFSPITLAISEPNVLVVTSSLPVKSVKELIALAKARPGELNYAAGSTGSATHLAGELFNSLAGVKTVGVAYKTDSQEVADLITGQVQMSFQGGSRAKPLIELGKLRALAVGSAKPTALYPGLPVVAATLPGYESISSQGAFVPSKTPAVIITRLHQEIVRVLNQPDVKQRFFDSGVDIIANSPEEAAAWMRIEIARLSKVIKDAGIRID